MNRRRPASTLVAGSYHRHDLMGASLGDASALPFADQTLLGIVQAQPSVVYTEWAAQTGDIAWSESLPTSNYQAFAITDQQLVAATTVATAAPQALAVITPTLSFATTVQKAFVGTPYAYVRTEAVYAQLDPTQPPRILFLYWIQLRALTDTDTGPTSLNYAATSVLGVLTYILEVPTSSADRPRPSTSFAQALAAQQGGGLPSIPTSPASPSSLPGLPSLPGITPAPSPAPQSTIAASTTSDKSRAVLLVGLGAAAAFGGYRIFQHYRESRGRA